MMMIIYIYIEFIYIFRLQGYKINTQQVSRLQTGYKQVTIYETGYRIKNSTRLLYVVLQHICKA